MGEIPCAWSLFTAPTLEPITVKEAKDHARITHDQEDGLVLSWIMTARQMAEDALQRGLYTQTWKLTLDRFATVIHLPMAAPLQSVTTVKYYDTSGVEQTLSSTVYVVDTLSRPGRIYLAPDQSWPSLQSDRLGGITITYVVGWSTVADIPERIKQGIRMAVAAMEADREGFDGAAQAAFRAAEGCWADRVTWIPPCD